MFETDTADALADRGRKATLNDESAGEIGRDKQKNSTEPRQAPIRFKDAVGRKFVFPFHLVNTWPGMESVIREAFRHVDVLEPHVQGGHYDLVGPNGEIILPSIWEHVVEPDWFISMQMWPMQQPLGVPPDKESIVSRSTGSRPVQPTEARLEGVFHFPEGAMADRTHSLHLALFDLQFGGSMQSAEVTISCDTGMLDSSPAHVEISKIGFFRRASSGAVLSEQTPDSCGQHHDAIESATFLVESPKEHGVCLLFRRRHGETAHSFSVSLDAQCVHYGGDVDRYQVEERINVDGRERTLWTPLSWAAANGWEGGLKLMLQEMGTLQNKRDHDGRSALSWAAGNGQEMATKLLLGEPEVQVNEGDNEGRTPLSWAAGNGQIKTMDLLLAQTDRINAGSADCHGRTPLSWAAGNGHTDAVLALISYGKKSVGIPSLSIDDTENPGNSPVCWAARNGREDVLGILVEEGLQIAEKPEKRRNLPWGQFYLHKAAEQGWATLTKLLIDKKVPVNSIDPDNDARTPLCVAAEQGQSEVVRILLQAGAASNYQTGRARDTPLGLAIRHGHEGPVKALLGAGADVLLENAKGESPMDLAKHHPTIFQMTVVADKDGRLAETEDRHLHSAIDHEFKATVIDFFFVSGVYKPHVAEISVDDLLKNPRYSNDPDAVFPSLRWLHLPANNLQLIAYSSRSAGSGGNTMAPLGCITPDSCGHIARRSQAPHPLMIAADFPTWTASVLGGALEPEETDYRADLVLFMPFLHWDLEDVRSKRDAIVNPASCGGSLNLTLNRDQKLLKAYLTNDHPLHVRRTLDQYYYHTLTDTTMRDQDQVVRRYQAEAHMQPRILTMVDQLWLWVLHGLNGKSDTVISCFPFVEQEGILKHPDPYGLTDVLRRVKLYILDAPSSVQTAYDLAGLIAATCSRVYFDRASILSFEDTKSTLQFSELYETVVRNTIQEEAALFRRFMHLRKENLSDIRSEISLLSKIRDAHDELNIMAMVFDDQRKVLKVMDSIVKSASTPEIINTSFGTTESGTMSDEELGKTKADKPLGRARDSMSEVDVRVNREEGYTGQRITAIWGTRNDSDDFSLPLAMVKASIDEISRMIERAERASQAANFLVDLKLKQNSVMDAQESLKQGRTVLVFTLTTIVFLPLSFMATFLTLDISQFQTNSEGELDLGYVLYIIFPISTLISAILIGVAFKVERVKAAWNWATGSVSRMSSITKPSKTKRGTMRYIPGQSQAAAILRASDLEAQKRGTGSYATGDNSLIQLEQQQQQGGAAGVDDEAAATSLADGETISVKDLRSKINTIRFANKFEEYETETQGNKAGEHAGAEGFRPQ
ncbi:hypothetical protein DL770_002292 [Monosporascus sp. CRB-9-2]|nr:hypothetical protein DL770_002292 [Monosporascus sp. CRB-9-2]